MSNNRQKQVDFIPTNYENFQKIKRPSAQTNPNKQSNHSRSLNQSVKAESSKSSFTIEKTWVPERQPEINEMIAPQLKKLKDFYKKKIEHEKKLKQMLAQGKIQKEDIEGRKDKQMQQANQAKVEKVKIDEAGQIRDQKGNIMFVKNRTAQLNINKRIEEGAKLKEISKKQKIKYHENLSRKLRDANLVMMSGNKKRIKRQRLGLQFMQKGSYQSVSALQDFQVKKQVQSLSDVFKNDSQAFQNEVKTRIIKKRSRSHLQHNNQIPDIQWWDKGILHCQNYQNILAQLKINLQDQNIDEIIMSNSQIERFLNFDEITEEVKYQKVGNDDVGKDDNIIMPMFLTKTERKKLKRKRKKQKLLQKNDKVKLGLIEPQKPKLRVANMAVVMKNEFILDPSKIEQLAKKEQAERLNKHMESNSSRKLTKQQRQDKHIRKLKRDSAKECRRAVFKLGKLNNPSQLFKVNMNAKQLALNGFVIKPSDYHRQVVMVAVQGGSRAVKFYKNLMLNRIKWGQQRQQGQPQEGEKQSGPSANQSQKNKCILVWQGSVDNTTLGKWKVHQVGDESETLKILKEKGVQHFWDYIAN